MKLQTIYNVIKIVDVTNARLNLNSSWRGNGLLSTDKWNTQDRIAIFWTFTHQGEVKTNEELDIPATLNIEVDRETTTKARTPINTHLLSAPFAIY